MKNVITILVTVGLFLLANHAFGAPYRDPSTQANYDQVRVLHYEMDLEIDPELQFISKSIQQERGSDGYRGKVYYSVKTLKPTKEIVFDAVGLKVGKAFLLETSSKIFRRADLTSNTTPKTLEVQVDKQKVTLTLPKKVQPNRYLLLSVEVNGASYDGGLYFAPPSATGSGIPAAFTQLEDIDARKIIPCQDTPQVHSSFTTNLITPKKFNSFASGELKVEKVTEDGRKLRTFDADFTIPIYLYALAVGNLEATQLSDTLEVLYEPQHKKSAITYAKDADQIVRYYEDYLGTPFPLSKMRIAFIPGFPWGGMENMGFIFLQERFLVRDNVRLPNGISVLPHEVVHHWYGNTVTMADRRHIFVNEGPTSFLDMEYLEDLLQQNRINALWQRPRLSSFSQEFNKRRDPRWGSMLTDPSVDSSPSFGDRYDKGSWIFREVRYLLGRDGVQYVLSEILPKEEGKKKLLTVKEFAKAIKKMMNKYAKDNNLQLYRGAEEYIEDLMLKPGHPELEVSCRRDKDNKLTMVTLSQPRERKNSDGTKRHGHVYKIGTIEYKLAHKERTQSYGLQPLTSREIKIYLPEEESYAFYLDPKGQRFVDIQYSKECFDLGRGIFVDVDPGDHRILSELDDQVEFVRVLRTQVSEKATRARMKFSDYLRPFPPKVSALLRTERVLTSENALKNLTPFMAEKDVPLRLEYSKAIFNQIDPEKIDRPEAWSAKFLEALAAEKAYRIQAYWYANALLTSSDENRENTLKTVDQFYGRYLPLPGWGTLFNNIKSLAKRSPEASNLAAASLLKFGARKSVPVPTAQLNMLNTLKEFAEDSTMQNVFESAYLELREEDASILKKYRSFFFAPKVTNKERDQAERSRS